MADFVIGISGVRFRITHTPAPVEKTIASVSSTEKTISTVSSTEKTIATVSSTEKTIS